MGIWAKNLKGRKRKAVPIHPGIKVSGTRAPVPISRITRIRNRGPHVCCAQNAVIATMVKR